MSEELNQEVTEAPEYGLKEIAESPAVSDQPVSLADSINAVLERCAKLVETSHTAHDLHEIAAEIRSWKE